MKNFLFTAYENLAIVRAFSLLFAVGFSLILFINPHIIASESVHIAHGLLSLQMIAICCAFVHGIGFSAVQLWGRLLISPCWHWPIMLTILVGDFHG
jgi:predicted membrane protein